MSILTVTRINLNKIHYIGIFALATEDYLIVPKRFGKIPEEKILETMNVEIIHSHVSQSPLIGILSAGNTSGLLVPDLIDSDEKEFKEKLGINVKKIPSKYTALGNQILTNDNGAIVSPNLSEKSVEIVEKTLNVQTKRGTIAGLKNVGAAGIATNKGVLLHPEASEDELSMTEEVLGVQGDIGTALSGVKYVGACIVANSQGALTGENTTGPELGRIESALGFL